MSVLVRSFKATKHDKTKHFAGPHRSVCYSCNSQSGLGSCQTKVRCQVGEVRTTSFFSSLQANTWLLYKVKR